MLHHTRLPKNRMYITCKRRLQVIYNETITWFLTESKAPKCIQMLQNVYTKIIDINLKLCYIIPPIMTLTTKLAKELIKAPARVHLLLFTPTARK